VLVKSAIAADANAIAQIAKETFALACPPSADANELEKYIDCNLNAERFNEFIASQSTYISCAFVNGEMAGFIVAVYDSPCVDIADLTATAEIQKLYIRPRFHGKEIAYNLMTSAIAEVTKPGIEKIWLGVYSDNIRAKKFYSKFGFHVVGETYFIMGSERHLDHIMAINVL
jgi:ribosomal protein S18 acetylase RimI-like enzyme